ncbi:MAG: HupE/UreJ family protein [Minwuia sp.]|uniref:HupE/UreJ family protein n=1 Tax=Minwuia sp. TaxID=2493630 RepID=UPI003A85CB8E
MIGRIRGGLAAAALASLPAQAFAHTTIEGIDAVYGGLLHPYFVPGHILALTALALLVGIMSWAIWRLAIPVYLAALLAGLAIGAAGIPPWQPAIVLLVLAMLCGGGAALALPSNSMAAAVAAALIGVTVGLDSVPEDLSAGVPWQVLAATFIGAGVFPAYVGALLLRFRRGWLTLGARIAGSWVVAVSAMVLALSLAQA